MSKKVGIVVCIISVIAIILSVVALVVVWKPAEKPDSDAESVQYILYLGTNDKDTNQPKFSPSESKEKAEEILLKHFGGYTIQEAQGGWIDEDNTYQEYTLVIHLSDTTLDKVHAASDEMVQVFNQSSILIQTNHSNTEFYEGRK